MAKDPLKISEPDLSGLTPFRVNMDAAFRQQGGLMSRRIEFEKLMNTRDLGGMETADGRKIKPGRLIRSGHLVDAADKDVEKLTAMVDTIVDFRTIQEWHERRDPQIPGVRYFHLPILDERKAGVTRDEKSYEEVRDNMLDEAELAREYMRRVYTRFVTSEFSRSQYARFVRILLEDHSKAVLWHCTAGKDRAGFGTVIVQEILGVSREDIMQDYLITSVYLEPEIKEIIRKITHGKGFSSPESEKGLRYMFAAWQEYLEATYEKIGEVYGDFDGYIRDGLEITPEECRKLKEMYLE